MSYVYFVRQEGTELLKIGRSANPLRRFESLQTGSPHHLTLVGYLRETDELNESVLHTRFRAFRAKGEWFREGFEIATFLNSLQDAFKAPLDIHRLEMERSLRSRAASLDDLERDLSLQEAAAGEARIALERAVGAVEAISKNISFHFAQPASRFIDSTTVLNRMLICISTLNELIAAGRFPTPISNFKSSKKLWLEADVEDAIVKLARGLA